MGKIFTTHSLTLRQLSIFSFIEKFIEVNGYSPTIREIKEGVNPKISSTSVVDYNLEVLVKKGYILQEKNIARSIRLKSLDLEHKFQ